MTLFTCYLVVVGTLSAGDQGSPSKTIALSHKLANLLGDIVDLTSDSGVPLESG